MGSLSVAPGQRNFAWMGSVALWMQMEEAWLTAGSVRQFHCFWPNGIWTHSDTKLRGSGLFFMAFVSSPAKEPCVLLRGEAKAAIVGSRIPNFYALSGTVCKGVVMIVRVRVSLFSVTSHTCVGHSENHRCFPGSPWGSGHQRRHLFQAKFWILSADAERSVPDNLPSMRRAMTSRGLVTSGHL